MPQANMHIHVSVPTFNSLTDPEKSIINFFLKDARMYFKGSYTGTTLDALYGSIRPDYRTIIETSNDSDRFIYQNSMELYIPYTVDSISSPATYPVHTDGVIPKFPLTLLEKESRLRFYWLEKQSESNVTWREANVYHSNSSTVESIAPIENIGMVLTPMIGSATSSNPDVSIPSITSSSTELSLGITSETGFDCDYQLRTSSLFIDDGNGTIAENVFYKMGIVPFSKKYNKTGTGTPDNTEQTVEGLKTFLKTKQFLIRAGYGYMLNTHLSFSLNYAHFAVGTTSLSDQDYWESVVPMSFIIPIIADDNVSVLGLLYARMFRSDGTEFSQNYVPDSSLKLYYRESEDDPDPVLISIYDGKIQQPLNITDQSIDGGWVQPPAN